MPFMKSLSERMDRLRSNPLVVALVLFVAAVTTLASFTDSVSKLTDLFHHAGPEAARAELSKLGIPFTARSLQEKAHDGDLVAVKTLLQAGMPADAMTENAGGDDPNMPALAEAAARGDVAMVQTLLASHADPTFGKGAAIKAAVDHRHNEILQVFLKQPAPEPVIRRALVSAAFRMNLDAVRLLAARLADPKPALSQALLTMCSPNGWGEADLAALDRLLLQSGANPNAAEADGITPLMLVADSGPVERMGALLDAGAAANTRCACPDWSGGGWTALALAARSGDAQKVRRLIAARADVNVRNGDGDTPLILASRLPSIDIVAALLKAGADVKARARNGESATAIAKQGSRWPDRTVYNPELVRLLSSYGGE